MSGRKARDPLLVRLQWWLQLEQLCLPLCTVERLVREANTRDTLR